MKLQGSFFVEESITVLDYGMDKNWPISVCLDGSEVVLHLTEQQGNVLESQLRNALMSVAHDRAEARNTWMPTYCVCGHPDTEHDSTFGWAQCRGLIASDETCACYKYEAVDE
jgi:hypothetical protein